MLGHSILQTLALVLGVLMTRDSLLNPIVELSIMNKWVYEI